MSRCSSTPLAIVIAPILICVLASVVLALEFGYAESYGPEQWGECSGRHHSPLTIDLVNAVEKNFTELEIINFNVVPRTFEMSNNGHTVLVKMSFNKETVPTVKGGPLAEKTPLGYQFEQFHFYWGDNETFANKDVAINQAYLFELHLVLRNSEYPNLTIAMEKDHGIAVMAFYFHIGLVPARGYTDFTDLLAQIDRKGQTVNMNYPLPLGEYISKYLDNYFSYSDSLTIPPCSVEATWLYFPYTIDISEEQFNVFHRLTASDDHLKNDFPPSEPFNVGTLYKNKETRNDSYSVPLVNVANAAEKWMPHLMGALLYFCVLVPLLRTSDFSGF